MLQVLCSETELGEYGETITVGDRVSRVASRVVSAGYGTALDSIGWRFDRYAGGDEAATIEGTVTAISAVYVELTQLGACGWTAAHGTAHSEPLGTTGDTRKPGQVVDWDPPSASDGTGVAYRLGHARIEEGDEHLSGWVVTLEDERMVLG